VLTVRAIDADSFYGVVKYAIVGDETASRFFSVDENTGVVRIKSDLAGETDAIYRYAACLISWLCGRTHKSNLPTCVSISADDTLSNIRYRMHYFN